MKRSSGPRKTANLSESVHQQLNMYALAAGAAGVSLFALAQKAEAKIIYTPSHKKVSFRFDDPISFDLNHDGIKDFSLAGYGHTSASAWLLVQRTAQGPDNAILAVKSGDNTCALALPGGKSVGPKGQFISGGFMFDVTSGGFSICPWRGLKKPAYLGLKVAIKGKTHYGWARLSVQAPGHGVKFSKAILTGYAYETIPDKPIITGRANEAADDPTNEDFGPGASLTSPIPDKSQHATLGALAMGAPRLSIWRRERSVGAGR